MGPGPGLHLCGRSEYASRQRSTRCSLMTASNSSSPQMGRPSGYSLPAGGDTPSGGGGRGGWGGGVVSAGRPQAGAALHDRFMRALSRVRWILSCAWRAGGRAAARSDPGKPDIQPQVLTCQLRGVAPPIDVGDLHQGQKFQFPWIVQQMMSFACFHVHICEDSALARLLTCAAVKPTHSSASSSRNSVLKLWKLQSGERVSVISLFRSYIKRGYLMLLGSRRQRQWWHRSKRRQQPAASAPFRRLRRLQDRNLCLER